VIVADPTQQRLCQEQGQTEAQQGEHSFGAPAALLRRRSSLKIGGYPDPSSLFWRQPSTAARSRDYRRFPSRSSANFGFSSVFGHERNEGRATAAARPEDTAGGNLSCRLLLCEVAKLVESFGRALAQHVGCLGAGLGRQHGDLAAVIEALFEHLFGVLGVFLRSGLQPKPAGRDRATGPRHPRSPDG